MQSTYLTPAEKEITIGIWTCTVSCREAVYNTSILQVAHYTETRIVSVQFDLMQSRSHMSGGYIKIRQIRFQDRDIFYLRK